jgi:hypothetical protein
MGNAPPNTTSRKIASRTLPDSSIELIGFSTLMWSIPNLFIGTRSKV